MTASEESQAFANFADFLYAFSFLLLVGFARAGLNENRVPWTLLALLCLESQHLFAEVFLSSSSSTEQLAQEIKMAPVAARNSLLTFTVYIIKKRRAAYEAFFACGVFLTTHTLFLSAVFSSGIKLILPSAEPNAHVPKPDESKEKKRNTSKKDKKKNVKEPTSTRAVEAAASPSQPLKASSVFPVGTPLSLMLVLCLAAGTGATILAWTRIPKGTQPATLQDILALLPKCMPARFGLVSLVRVVVTLVTRDFWIAQDGQESQSPFRVNMAGFALFIHMVALSSYVFGVSLDMIDAGSPVDVWGRMSLQKQGYLVTLAAQSVALMLGTLPLLLQLQPSITVGMVGVLSGVPVLLMQPAYFQLTFVELHSNLKILTCVTWAMIALFSGPAFLAVGGFTASWLANKFFAS